MPDGSVCYHHGSVVVEGDTVYVIFNSRTQRGSLRRSDDAGRTWSQPLPLFQNTGEEPSKYSEGALTRAKDGALVAALWTGMAPGYPNYSDHWRQILICRSTNNGKTWIEPQF